MNKFKIIAFYEFIEIKNLLEIKERPQNLFKLQKKSENERFNSKI